MSDHKSFLKWAGGKVKLLPRLRELGIEEGKRFIEPFVGSGVVSLNMPHREIIIADTNGGLINLWECLAVKDFIRECSHYFHPDFNNEKSYYEIRDSFNSFDTVPLMVKAAYFLYLNRHCFNGLCRLNSKGEFNVPYGRYKKVYFPEKELLHAIEVSSRMQIHRQSFTDTFKDVREGDMVYCDPPYIPTSLTSSFTTYSNNKFGTKEHEELVECARVAQRKGATVIISNNDSVYASRDLYYDAEQHFIDVQKNISCKGNGRKKQREIIAIYRPR